MNRRSFIKLLGATAAGAMLPAGALSAITEVFDRSPRNQSRHAGYVLLGDGRIAQWGTCKGGDSVIFPYEMLMVGAVTAMTSRTNEMALISHISRRSIVIHASPTETVMWVAIGWVEMPEHG